jgi:predicted RNA-binding protein with EMAP domain
MNEKERLLLALQQINNITNLIQDNQYKQFLYGKLISVEVELQRQLTNITYHERRRFQDSSKKPIDVA